MHAPSPASLFFLAVHSPRTLPHVPGRRAAVGGFAPSRLSPGTRGRVSVHFGAVRWCSPTRNPALTRGFTGFGTSRWMGVPSRETRALTDALAFPGRVAQSEFGVSVVAHLMRPEWRHTQPRVVVMVAPARGPTHPKVRRQFRKC